VASLNIPKFYLKLNGKLSKTTSICTPITGVLTKEPVEVKTVFFDKYKARAALNVSDSHQFSLLDTQSKIEIEVKRTELQKEFAVNVMAITTCFCHYEKMKNIEEISENLFKSCAIDLKNIREEHQVITRIISNPEKKLSTVVVVNNKTKEISAFAKGNPYKILEKCTRELIDGKKEPIDHQRRHKLKKRIEKMNKKGQKVIAFAYKAMPIKRLENYNEQLCETEMVLVGLIGLVENINSELIPYIEEIKKNKIKIYIITGVKEKKAVAIATEMRIINPNHFEAIDGEAIDNIDEQRFEKMLANRDKDYVFCDIKPNHRTRIINTLEKIGEIATFASKKHGHGIKELLEHIDRSRKNRKNSGKLIGHALNSKLAEIGLILAALLLRAPLPLSISLIIILDIFINIILELAINSDKNSDAQVVNQDRIFNPKLLINGTLSTITISIIYFWSLLRFGWIPGEAIQIDSIAYTKSSTMVFILLALIQIITAFEIINKEKSIFKNKPLSNLNLILTTIVCILILKTLTSYQSLEKILNLSELNGNEMAVILFSAFIFLLVIELYKVILRHTHTNENKHPLSEIPTHQSPSEKLDE
jgi:magnesium-transporting ATPase (P-type)